MNPTLLAVIIQELPDTIAFIKRLFATKHPGEPEPTEADIIAAFNTAYALSIAKDDAWLAAHPDA